MDFDNHVKSILHEETAKLIDQHGFFLESDFCPMVSRKYRLSESTVRAKLRDLSPELSLQRRRLSNELKAFFGAEIKGFPIIYLTVQTYHRK